MEVYESPKMEVIAFDSEDFHFRRFVDFHLFPPS